MAASIFSIPLSNIPQTFGISLANVNYNLTVKWNDADEAGWILDIADEDNNYLAAGLPLITGADILDGLNYLGINGSLVIYTDGDESAVPTLDDLGADSNLFFVTDVTDNG